ncbi:MAG: ATP-binding protein [Myxococcota bacterium]
MSGEGPLGVPRERAESGAHLLVATPAAAGTPPIAEALTPLARDGSLAWVHDLAGCIEHCRRVPVDLVVVDEALGRDAEEIVARLRTSGVGLLVVQAQPADPETLAWFRRGANECVIADRGFASLRHAAREQWERLASLRQAAPERVDAGADGILRHLGSALVVVDGRGAIRFANSGAEQILGESAELLRGQRFLDWVVDAEDAKALAAHPEPSARGFDTQLRGREGRSIPVSLSWGPVQGDAGDVQGAVVVFQDQSEAQEWRAHVLQTEKMASIGQLAAGVAHEINNPMGFIHANLFQMTEYVTDLRQVWSRTEGLQKAVDTEDLPAIRQAAEELGETAADVDVPFLLQDLAKAIRESQEGSERIRHIVQDLRDFSHQDTGERVLADLNACLEATANIVWPMMKHLVVLEREYGELPPVPCYPMQLKQVFMNLLVNAYQAIEDVVGDSGELGSVVLRTRAHDGGVEVSVRDSGVGIAAENLDRIFDPFFTTKKVGAGTGLGLSTSFSIVRRHGGTLGVESTPGEGTTFRLRLPLLRETIGSEPA